MNISSLFFISMLLFAYFVSSTRLRPSKVPLRDVSLKSDGLRTYFLRNLVLPQLIGTPVSTEELGLSDKRVRTALQQFTLNYLTKPRLTIAKLLQDAADLLLPQVFRPSLTKEEVEKHIWLGEQVQFYYDTHDDGKCVIPEDFAGLAIEKQFPAVKFINNIFTRSVNFNDSNGNDSFMGFITESKGEESALNIVFRGTILLNEWVSDGNIVGTLWKERLKHDHAEQSVRQRVDLIFDPQGELVVHDGFSDLYFRAIGGKARKPPSELCWDEVKRYVLKSTQEKKKPKIYITGHSLGGALAIVSAVDIGERIKEIFPSVDVDLDVVTFAGPKAFSQSELTEVVSNLGIKHTNYMNRFDVVPVIMPGQLGHSETMKKHKFNQEEILKTKKACGLGQSHNLEHILYNLSFTTEGVKKRPEHLVTKSDDILDDSVPANWYKKFMSKVISKIATEKDVAIFLENYQKAHSNPKECALSTAM